MAEPDQNKKQSIAIDINPETTPILYTDNVVLSTNDSGVVMDVCQPVGPTRVRIVSRIGMSRTHAKKLLEELGRLLAMTEGQIKTGGSKKDN